MKRLVFLLVIGISIGIAGSAQSKASPKASARPSTAPAVTIKPVGDLVLGPADLRMELSNDGGYILFIRKKANIQSVLLTESTEDPGHKMASYALRSKEANPVNGEPLRKLDGEILNKKDMHFLLSSDPVADSQFGKAFRIFIPYVVVYGYPWGRYGERAILDGSYLSIRAFNLPYADYDGGYKDNPYLLKLSQVKLDTAAAGYNKETIKAFKAYAAINQGQVWNSPGGTDTIATLVQVLDSIKAEAIDLVICLDAAQSMAKNAGDIRQKLVPALRAFAANHEGSRFALVQYRDYMEDFLYKVTPFTTDFSILQAAIDLYQPAGGRDFPEAVNEALYASLTELEWALKNRMTILLGNAPPHPIPRGTVTGEMVSQEAISRKVVIDPIILPN